MKKFVQKWWKKALISLVIAVVLAVALEFLQVKTQPPYYEYREIAVTIPSLFQWMLQRLLPAFRRTVS